MRNLIARRRRRERKYATEIYLYRGQDYVCGVLVSVIVFTSITLRNWEVTYWGVELVTFADSVLSVTEGCELSVVNGGSLALSEVHGRILKKLRFGWKRLRLLEVPLSIIGGHGYTNAKPKPSIRIHIGEINLRGESMHMLHRCRLHLVSNFTCVVATTGMGSGR